MRRTCAKRQAIVDKAMNVTTLAHDRWQSGRRYARLWTLARSHPVPYARPQGRGGRQAGPDRAARPCSKET